jgi:hypothetical protein
LVVCLAGEHRDHFIQFFALDGEGEAWFQVTVERASAARASVPTAALNRNSEAARPQPAPKRSPAAACHW